MREKRRLGEGKEKIREREWSKFGRGKRKIRRGKRED